MMKCLQLIHFWLTNSSTNCYAHTKLGYINRIGSRHYTLAHIHFGFALKEKSARIVFVSFEMVEKKKSFVRINGSVVSVCGSVSESVTRRTNESAAEL